MGDETWASIQLVKNKREIFREKLKRRKAERDTILSVTSGSGSHSPSSPASSSFSLGTPVTEAPLTIVTKQTSNSQVKSKELDLFTDHLNSGKSNSNIVFCAELDKCLMSILSDSIPPVTLEQLLVNPRLKKILSHIHALTNSGALCSEAVTQLSNLLQKFAYKELICLNEVGKVVMSVQHSRITAALEHTKQILQQHENASINIKSGTCDLKINKVEDDKISINSSTNKDEGNNGQEYKKCASMVTIKHGLEDIIDNPSEVSNKKIKREDYSDKDDVMSLLSAQSIRERENKRVGEEILELLNKPSAKEKSVAQHFRSQGGAKVREFCPRGTAEECIKSRGKLPSADISGGTKSIKVTSCGKLHFRKIIQPHTDESLGDCSFLNTCFHMDTCRYVHYEVDYSGMEELVESNPELLSDQSIGGNSHTAANNQDDSIPPSKSSGGLLSPRRTHDRTVLFPPQWIQCDLRFLDMSILGKFSVIMADPPWDIHMELPYGTMSDDEMRELNIPALQDEGLIFLWVTGRAMELGRECLTLWGYERVDEIIWVKTNQLQRIIRTGRTGHWLNHGKEHCLVGMKGKPKINRCMDCDVIVAEVRATSHKPDEIYGIIERLSPGTRKIELFGRHHNVQPNWLTLGNQLEGVNLLEEEFRKFHEHHPAGVCGKR